MPGLIPESAILDDDEPVLPLEAPVPLPGRGRRHLRRLRANPVTLAGVSLLSFSLYPFLGVSFFPRTDPGQMVINLKAPSGTRVELTENYVKRVEQIIHQVVPASELQIIVSNIGITTDFSAITPPTPRHTPPSSK